MGNAKAKNTTPIHRAVVLHPKWAGVTDQASKGNSNSPPRGDPSAATAIANPRFRMNHLLTTVINGSQLPAAVPNMIKP